MAIPQKNFSSPASKKTNQRLAPAVGGGAWRVLLGAVFISFSAVFARTVTVGPTASAFYRMLIGAVILLILARLRESFPPVSGKLLAVPVLCGAFFCADLWVWHKSVLAVGPGLATILGNFQVFVLAFCGVVFFKERIEPRLLLSIPLAVFGLLLLLGFEWSSLSQDYRLGVGLGLLTAVFYSAYILTLRRTQTAGRRLAPMTNLALISFSSAALLAVVALLEGESLLITSSRDAFFLILYGLIGQVLGWLLISKGLPDTDISVAGLLLLLQPGLALLWDILFFGRSTTNSELAGAAIVLFAIYLGSTAKRRVARRQQ